MPRPDQAAAPRRARVEGSKRGAPQLAQALVRMVASETRLASELEALFRGSRGVPLRLALSDRRRETKIQIDRLRCVLTMVAGRHRSSLAPGSDANVDVASTAHLPVAAVVAALLRASHAAVGQYQTAIAIAAAGGLVFAVNLLTISLNAELAAVQRLSTMSGSITGE